MAHTSHAIRQNSTTMTQKRVLVVGSAGFIGSNLATELLKSGHEVVGVDSLTASYGNRLPQIRREKLAHLSQNMEIIDGNILDLNVQDRILSTGAFDSVFHLAAWPGVRGGEEDPSSYLKNNVEALCASLRTAHNAEVERFIFASSSSIYGNQGTIGACSESVAGGGNQLSFYAATKWIGEQIVTEFIKRTQLSGISARFFTVIGPNGRPDMAYANFARALITRKPLKVYGNGSALRDYTSITDTVWALRNLCELDHPKYQIPGNCIALNIGFGRSYSVIQLVSAIQNALAIGEVEIDYQPQPIVDAQATLSDPSLLHELFGKRDAEDLDSMVRKALSQPDWIFE